jgi:hypothetical protein
VRRPLPFHQQQRADDEEEREGIGRVDPADVGDRNHDAADRRACDRRGLHRDRVQADGIREVVSWHERRHQGLTRRKIERARGRTAHREHVDRPELAEAAKRQDCEDAGKRGHHRLRDEHQRAAIQGIRSHAADE